MYGQTKLLEAEKPAWSNDQYLDWADSWKDISHNPAFQYTLNDSHPSSNNFVVGRYPAPKEAAPHNATGCTDGYYRWWTLSDLYNPGPEDLTCVLSTDMQATPREQVALRILQEAPQLIRQLVPDYLGLTERVLRASLGVPPARQAYWSQAVRGQLRLPNAFGTRSFEEACMLYDDMLRPTPENKVTYTLQGKHLVSRHPRRKRPLLRIYHPQVLNLYTELGLRLWQLARDIRLRERQLLTYALG